LRAKIASRRLFGGPERNAVALERLREVLNKEGRDPSDALRILAEIDQALRFEVQRLSYMLRQRRSPSGRAFQKSWSEHTRRGRLSFATFDRLKRKLGGPEAAARAAKIWNEPIGRRLGEETVRAQAMPMLVWETAIGNVLIDELQRHLNRKLRFSRGATGPDIRLLVELYSIAATECSRVTGVLDHPRGKRARKPGSASWFANKLRYQRPQNHPQEGG
jgi:hypothetical protein